MADIKTYIQEKKQDFLDELFEVLRIPSISAQKEHAQDVVKAAEFFKDKLSDAGVTHAEIHQTDGHPILYAQTDIDPNKKTILVYGHYDVQPPEPLDKWTTRPFEPEIRDGKIYARGASDDKGQAYIHVKALEVLKAQGDDFPCNVKFLLEGEEEVGSDNLYPFVEKHMDMLGCDVVVISDTAMVSNDNPSICTGLRGMAGLEVTVTGPNKDLHSGIYGGAVHNPIHVLSEMLGKLHGDDGSVLVPGFYDGVVELTEKERIAIAEKPFNEDNYKKDLGVKALFGEEGYTTIERAGVRPTVEVNGIFGGYTGEGHKTVLPSQAHAKITMRLVHGQNHDNMNKLLGSYLKEIAPPTVKVDIHGDKYASPAPNPTALDSVGYKAAENAYEIAWGKKPIPTRDGGSIPVVGLFQEQLGVDVILTGFGLDSDVIHSPDENFGVENFLKGIETVAEFHKGYATLKV